MCQVPSPSKTQSRIHITSVEGDHMAVKRFPVEASHILMFARAIGDENPVYTDPSSPEAAAVRWGHRPADVHDGQLAVRSRCRPAAEGGRALVRVGQRAVRRGDHEHRPSARRAALRVPPPARGRRGARQRPSATAQTWEKESKRGGSLLFEEKFIEYSNIDTGELVVTARFVTVLPSQVVKQDGREPW